MATEIVGGAALAPPTAVGARAGGQTAAARAVPAGRRSILVGLFFVPLGADVRLLVLVDGREPRRRPDLEPRELRRTSSATRPTSGRCSRRCSSGPASRSPASWSAFVVAYFLARYVSRRWARIALLVIIVPFWTSYLLRVYSWQAILGERGALNQVLMALGIIAEPSLPVRLQRHRRRSSSSSTSMSRSRRWSSTPRSSGSTSPS